MVSSRDCAVSSVAYKISSRNRTHKHGLESWCLCDDHVWSRVETRGSRLATCVAIYVLELSWSWSRVGTRGLDPPATADSAQLYYPIEFWFHATIVYYPLNMFSCLIINQNGSNNQISNIQTTFISYSTSSSYIHHVHQIFITQTTLIQTKLWTTTH